MLPTCNPSIMARVVHLRLYVGILVRDRFSDDYESLHSGFHSASDLDNIGIVSPVY